MLKNHKRRNRRGDSLIEVITAFAVVSIVGLMVVSSVTVSSKIKNTTTFSKEASLAADKALQNTSSPVSATDIKATIYSTDGTGAKAAAVANNSDLTLLKYTGSSTVNSSSIGYKYYERGTFSNTPSSGGTGAFGMGGQWTIRFYLEEEVTKALQAYDEFYVVMSYSGGFPGESSTMETTNLGVTPMGYVREKYNAKDYYVFGYANLCQLENKIYIYDNNGTEPRDITGLDEQFPTDGSVLSLARKFDYNYKGFNDDEDGGVWKANSIQAFDCTYWWSSASSYGIDFDILVNDGGTYRKLSADDGSKAYRRYKVFYRDYGDGSLPDSEKVYTKYGDQFFNYKPDGNVYPDTALITAQDHNAVYNFDNYADYIYLWDKEQTKQADGSNNGVWDSDYGKINERIMLNLERDNVARTEITWATFIESNGGLGSNALTQEAKFREYLRLIDDQTWYTLYTDWLTSLGYSHSHSSPTDEERSACWDFWIYYLTAQYLPNNNTYGYNLYLPWGTAGANEWDAVTYTTEKVTDISAYYKMLTEVNRDSKINSQIKTFDKLMSFLKKNGITDGLIVKDKNVVYNNFIKAATNSSPYDIGKYNKILELFDEADGREQIVRYCDNIDNFPNQYNSTLSDDALQANARLLAYRLYVSDDEWYAAVDYIDKVSDKPKTFNALYYYHFLNEGAISADSDLESDSVYQEVRNWMQTQGYIS